MKREHESKRRHSARCVLTWKRWLPAPCFRSTPDLIECSVGAVLGARLVATSVASSAATTARGVSGCATTAAGASAVITSASAAAAVSATADFFAAGSSAVAGSVGASFLPDTPERAAARAFERAEPTSGLLALAAAFASAALAAHAIMALPAGTWSATAANARGETRGERASSNEAEQDGLMGALAHVSLFDAFCVCNAYP